MTTPPSKDCPQYAPPQLPENHLKSSPVDSSSLQFQRPVLRISEVTMAYSIGMKVKMVNLSPETTRSSGSLI
jgi:hypothetical protein